MMGSVKRAWIESMEPKEEPPMGVMKAYDIRIRSGGDDAIAAVSELTAHLEGEIERLRSLTRFQDGVIRSGDVACLTAAEREAVRSCIADDQAATAYQRADTLRGLLERLGATNKTDGYVE